MSNSLYLAPNSMAGARWGISVEDMPALLTGWPGLRASVYDGADGPALQFRWVDDGGAEAVGGYLVGRYEALRTETPFDPKMWAPFFSWFLGQLPAGIGAIVFTEVDPVPVSLPSHPSPGQIVEAYATVEAGG